MKIARLFRRDPPHLADRVPHDGGIGAIIPIDEVYLTMVTPGVWQIVDNREVIAKASPSVARRLREIIAHIASIDRRMAWIDRWL